MDDNISGFFGPVTGYAQPASGTFTLLHASEEGFFELYRGERAGRFRIFKCLKPEWRGSLLHETMLKKEFEIGYSLRHPNIRETYAYTEHSDLGPCVEMEWIDGVTLDEYLQRGRPDGKTFRRWASELCDALSYLHSRQVVHRDLKPGNIMVTHGDGSIRLIDFGLADRADSSVLKAPAGTRRFVAPEVLAGSPADVRSDIYSLGMVLREMTSGHRRVLNRCLRKDPQKRYRSAKAVKEALNSRLWIYGLIAVLAVLLLAVLLFLLRPAPVSETEPSVPVRDTVVILMKEKPQEHAGQKPATKAPKSTKEEDLDRIFRQATDLFEENL